MKKLIQLFILSSVLWSCVQENSFDVKRTPPEKLITRPEMVNLMKEIHLAEAVTSASSLTYHKSLARYKRYKLHIFKKYGLDSAGFNQNFEYYMGNIEDLEYIYQALEDTFLLRKHNKNFLD